MIKTEVKEYIGYELFQKLLSEKRKLISEKIILDKKDNHKYPITNTPFNIPDSWYWCYLSDISIIQEGPGLRKHQYQVEGIQFLTVTNILEDAIDLGKSKKYISKSEYEKTYSHFTINKGDIVTACSGGSWGKSAMFELDDKLILNTSTLRLRFFNDLGDNRYLYYLTKTSYFKDSLSSYITGQQPNYGYSHYSKIPIPLPPLPEQQRIIAILDEVFAAIDKAKANAEKNLKNAKEMFESYLQGVFESGDCEKKTIQEVTKIINGYAFASKDFNSKNTIKSIKITNVGVKEFVEEVDNYLPDKFKETLKEVQVREGNIVIALTRTIISSGLKVAIVPTSYDGALVNQRVAALVANEKIINQKYLYNFLTTDGVAKYVLAHVNTLMQPNLSINDLKKLPVPCPSIKEQQIIVQKLDSLSIETKRLEAIYQQKLTDLEELKKSILQKAFNGELNTKEICA